MQDTLPQDILGLQLPVQSILEGDWGRKDGELLMTKQEEIEKGIATLTGDYVSQILKEKWITVELTKLILKYLDSKDVAIEVDKPLPPLISKDIYDKDEIDIAIKQAALMVESGYTATEPLIRKGEDPNAQAPSQEEG